MSEHPDLADAAVVAVAYPVFGQGLLAWVVPKPGTTVDASTLREWLRLRLDRCKLPREINLAASIPRNALVKVDQQALVHLPPA